MFWFVVALLFAAIEVESEGRHGWAEKMPTWYRTRGPIAKLYGGLMGGKPLTGYHLFMLFLPLLIMHSAFVSGARWSLANELEQLALYFVWAPMWDYLWFVLNPAYGASGFKRHRVWWHAQSHWVAGLFPADYLLGLTVSMTLAIAATGLGNPYALADEIITVAVFLTLTFVTIGFSGMYHWWYHWMRRRDDRDATDIFHDDSDGT